MAITTTISDKVERGLTMNSAKKLVTVLGGGERYFARMLVTQPDAQVALWPLTEGTGIVANDVSGNNLHGSYVDGLPLRASRINGARTPLFGDGGYVNLYSAGLNTAFPRTEGTIFSWGLNTNWSDGDSDRTLLRIYADTDNDIRIYKYGSSGALYAFRKAGGTRHQGAVVPASMTTVFSAAIVYNTSTPLIQIYVNGGLIYESETDVLEFVGNIVSTICILGKPSTGIGWTGSIGFLGIWNKALTETEILYLSKKVSASPSMYEGGLTIAVIPDTQSYVQEASPVRFNRQTQWIVDNADDFNIIATIHEGDLVETVGTATEWTKADTAMDILDIIEMPYLTCIGNHDWNNEETRDSTTFNTNFPQTRYTTRDWWNGGFYAESKSENAYMLVTVDDIDFIFVTLEENPPSEVITWANALLTTHSTKKAIITTHSYLETDGTVLASQQYIWDDLLKLHDNIMLVLCGHRVLPFEGAARRTDNNVNGKPIHQVLANYQKILSVAGTGLGYMRLMTLLPAQNKIKVQTYSPSMFDVKSDENNYFELDYDFS